MQSGCRPVCNQMKHTEMSAVAKYLFIELSRLILTMKKLSPKDVLTVEHKVGDKVSGT